MQQNARHRALPEHSWRVPHVVSDEEYDLEALQFKSDLAAGCDGGRLPPLNPEQRLAARSFLRVCELRVELIRSGSFSGHTFQAALKREGLTNVIMLCGPGGRGNRLLSTSLSWHWLSLDLVRW